MTASTIHVDAFLCDSIQGLGAKLYALGIGWNVIDAAQFPARHSRLGVGLVIHIPYTATNQTHEFSVHIENEDGAPLPLAEAGPGTDPRTVEDGHVIRLGGSFNVGRPPELPPGDEQIVPLALQLDQIEFPAPGIYSMVVEIDKNDEARLPFRLRQLQQMQIPTS
jgi:hypothetical protein